MAKLGALLPVCDAARAALSATTAAYTQGRRCDVGAGSYSVQLGLGLSWLALPVVVVFPAKAADGKAKGQCFRSLVSTKRGVGRCWDLW